MSISNQSIITEEAWVKGTSLEDERVRGYVEAISPDGQTAKVRAIESDNPASASASSISTTPSYRVFSNSPTVS